MFVSIDSGNNSGWAIWRCGVLMACGLGDPRRCPMHLVTSSVEGIDVIDDAWIESPVIRPRSRARPNDIIKLARNAGEWGGMYGVCGVDVHYVEPSTWKGSIDKKRHHPRIWAALFEHEHEVLQESIADMADSKSHNVIDAVGLGLWVLKRDNTRGR